MIELLPCPFCGGEAYYRKPIPEKRGCFETMVVECKHCGASPFGVSVYDGETLDHKRGTIAKFWNMRNDRFHQNAVDYRIKYGKQYNCSECGRTQFSGVLESGKDCWEYEAPKYCSHCGAAMERSR